MVNYNCDLFITAIGNHGGNAHSRIALFAARDSHDGDMLSVREHLFSRALRG